MSYRQWSLGLLRRGEFGVAEVRRRGRPEQMGEVIARAFQVAASDPPGPVYLTLPREVLMTEVSDVGLPSLAQTPPARLGAGDPDALRDIAARLVRSERPVVLTSTSGRTKAGFEALVRLAEAMNPAGT